VVVGDQARWSRRSGDSLLPQAHAFGVQLIGPALKILHPGEEGTNGSLILRTEVTAEVPPSYCRLPVGSQDDESTDSLNGRWRACHATAVSPFAATSDALNVVPSRTMA